MKAEINGIMMWQILIDGGAAMSLLPIDMLSKVD